MKLGKHGQIPDSFAHHKSVAWLPDFVKCWIYHALNIYSPSMTLTRNALVCPICGKEYRKLS